MLVEVGWGRGAVPLVYLTVQIQKIIPTGHRALPENMLTRLTSLSFLLIVDLNVLSSECYGFSVGPLICIVLIILEWISGDDESFQFHSTGG